MNNYYLYWYHLKTHSDPYTEGYIGVTKDINRRYNEHMRNSNKLKNHFYNALDCYGKENVLLTVLHIVSDEREVYDLESIYRPDPNTGWNFAAGGKDILGQFTVPVTLFHITNPSQEYSFKSIIEASKKLGITQARINQAMIRKSNIYGLDGWSVLHENTDKSTILTINEVRRNRFKGVKKDYSNKFKGVTNRWSDEEKKRIGSQHKGKIITEKQKETVRIKNRLTHSKCKEIQLHHKSNPDKVYIFHSISEAARQLDIPLSRLKSKCLRSKSYGKDGWMVTKLGSQDLPNE